MANLNLKFKKILKDLEENIKNKEDLEYMKSQMFNLYNIFFEQISENEELMTMKILEVLERQVKVEEKLQKLEKSLNDIEKDIYMDEDSEFNIICPYCNHDFIIDYDELKEEVTCPECKNLIELYWNDENNNSSCECKGCSGCKDNNEEDM